MKADKTETSAVILKKWNQRTKFVHYLLLKVFYLFSAGNLCVLLEKQEMQIKLKGSSCVRFDRHIDISSCQKKLKDVVDDGSASLNRHGVVSCVLNWAMSDFIASEM